jgi:hypothetical protein
VVRASAQLISGTLGGSRILAVSRYPLRGLDKSRGDFTHVEIVSTTDTKRDRKSTYRRKREIFLKLFPSLAIMERRYLAINTQRSYGDFTSGVRTSHCQVEIVVFSCC